MNSDWRWLLAVFALSTAAAPQGARAEEKKTPSFTAADVFDLEWISSPQFHPNGRRLVYVRRGFDIMTDAGRSQLWEMDVEGKNPRPLLDHPGAGAPLWSPDGRKLAFIAKGPEGKPQIFVHWVDFDRSLAVTHGPQSPRQMAWSPDGSQLAFVKSVPRPSKPMIELPKKPKGAKWAPPAKVVDELIYRIDGVGFLEPGHSHVFVVDSDGGRPRQVTQGDYDHEQPVWTKDGQALLVVGLRREDAEYDPVESEIYEVNVVTGEAKALTSRNGPDTDLALSPDGKRVAYLGFDDRKQGYQVRKLYVMNRDGSAPRPLSETLDRSVRRPKWAPDGKSIYFMYDDRGRTLIGRATMDGKLTVAAEDVGGTTMGRPYASGSFDVSAKGLLAFPTTSPRRPGELAVAKPGKTPKILVRPNTDLFPRIPLGEVKSLTARAPDGLESQAWVVTPPNFDPKKKYPLLLEIHGGPFANYGERFSAEMQLYAAAGYVVVYANPRGSTSYGQNFGNQIHHAYPGKDYDDLMAIVDEVMARGYIDESRLFVTGGSGGGVLTAWIVGTTDRFRAAVVAKPVINWTSFVLYADFSILFTQYWFPGMPWDHPEHYHQRSPLSRVGKVSTPTMLLTGESDYRTPIAESEQFYQALKLRKVDTALVRIPGASHGIARRPSQLLAKVLHVLKWFETHDRPVEK